MEVSDEYLTIAKTVATEFKEKGSRFIGHLHHIGSADEAADILNNYRKKYYDATHNCYAWYMDKEVIRYSDDGEPSGTAGRPILKVLEGSGMKELLCVITRYYGGTKLGTGGLVRAYSSSTQLCVDSAKKKIVIITDRIKLMHHYDHTSQVMHIIDKFKGGIVNSEYGDNVLLDVDLRLSNMEPFKKELMEATGGGVRFPEN